MSEHCGFIVEVKELREHPNADKLQLTSFFGQQVCVGLDVKVGDIGVYFPSDLQLGEQFCAENHLCRQTPLGEPDSGYLDPNKRNIKPIRLRGEQSDGIFCDLSCFDFTNANKSELTVGTMINVLNGFEICKKYIPRQPERHCKSEGNKTRKKKVAVAPLFAEHADTSQLAYNLAAFCPGDEIEITLKIHGTSQRTGYLPVFKGYKRTLLDRLLRKEGTPVYDWGYVSGTRRTVLQNYEGGYYGSNEFREQHSKIFEGKLHKGECCYYEVCGFTHTGSPIMPEVKNAVAGKDFVKQYGEKTVFSYGCTSTGKEGIGITERDVPQSDIYVYRMTMTNEDGFVVEYTPDFMRYRCEQMGVKCVPVLYKCILEERDWVNGETCAGDQAKNIAELFYDGPDPIGKTHIREGVVVRILNRPKFTAYKHKNFNFKLIEGIAKDTAEAPDMEEAQDA